MTGVFDRLFRRRRELVCRDAVALMTDYLDGVLAPAERARLEGHLAGCPHCSAYLDQLRTTRDALARIEPDDVDPQVMDELVDLYRRWQRG